jgi:flagellar motor protein MotB
MKKKHEEHANHERWVVSYADFITLLFAFFVVLYAVSEVDKQKMKRVARAVQFAFHFKGSGGTETAGLFDKSGARPSEIDPGVSQWVRTNPDAMRFFTQELPETYRNAGGDDLVVSFDQETVTVEFKVSALFDPSWDRPREDGVQLLDKISQGLRQFGGKVEVRLEVPEQRSLDQMRRQYLRMASLRYYLCGLLNVGSERYADKIVQTKADRLGSLDEVLATPDEFSTMKFLMNP